jgi:hypothetical protein
MASPGKWQRETRAENSRVPYIWNNTAMVNPNTQSSQRVIVMRRGNKYRAELYPSERARAQGQKPMKIIDSGTNKEDVRSEAVDWLRDNPTGV